MERLSFSSQLTPERGEQENTDSEKITFENLPQSVRETLEDIASANKALEAERLAILQKKADEGRGSEVPLNEDEDRRIKEIQAAKEGVFVKSEGGFTVFPLNMILEGNIYAARLLNSGMQNSQSRMYSMSPEEFLRTQIAGVDQILADMQNASASAGGDFNERAFLQERGVSEKLLEMTEAGRTFLATIEPSAANNADPQGTTEETSAGAPADSNEDSVVEGVESQGRERVDTVDASRESAEPTIEEELVQRIMDRRLKVFGRQGSKLHGDWRVVDEVRDGQVSLMKTERTLGNKARYMNQKIDVQAFVDDQKTALSESDLQKSNPALLNLMKDFMIEQGKRASE